MKKLLLFGAGNIGRSFIAQVFSAGGYEVVFVDINEKVLEALNREGRYRVILKRGADLDDGILWVENVRGVNGSDKETLHEEIASADVMATAVGKNVLKFLATDIAAGLLKRREQGGGPLDIIMAENLREAAAFMRAELVSHLPIDFDHESLLGLVESSIGKMVPIMTEADMAEDPLWVFAEPYNHLILDRLGFRNPVPKIDEIDAMENMPAWMDRKLFIHNLGHISQLI